MAAILPKLALRITTHPTDYTSGIQATINLDMSNTANIYAGDPNGDGQMIYSACVDSQLPVYTMREILSTTSTRSLIRTGYGVRLKFDVEVEWVSYRNYFSNTNPTNGGSWVADLDTIVNYLGGSTTGANDDYERYFWLCPSYQTPDEQWIRVEPDADSFNTGFGSKTWTRKMTCSFIASDLYKAISRATRSVGWTFTGDGTVSVTSPPGTTITGSGTYFLRDFYPGYQIQIGSDLWDIDAVGSNTSMTVTPRGFVSSHVAAAYTVIQSGDNTIKNWYYPVYTFTTFAGTQYGWGYNWGNLWSGTI